MLFAVFLGVTEVLVAAAYDFLAVFSEPGTVALGVWWQVGVTGRSSVTSLLTTARASLQCWLSVVGRVWASWMMASAARTESSRFSRRSM